MKFIVSALILHLVARTQSSNVTEEAPANKTKRTVAGQVHNYGENRPIVLYSDNPGTPLAPQSLASLYAPVTIKPVFDPEIPKQVAAQQVLYEFQQTPTNAVSNVHVNQFYQPVDGKIEAPPTNTGPAQFLSGSETVATPVQHSALIRHGQNYAQVQYNPLQGAPQHIQTHQYIPGKYLYVNGKILYQPDPIQNRYHQQQMNGLPQNRFQQRSSGLLYTHPQAGTQRFMPQIPLVQPRYRQFQPPQPHQIQPITKPLNAPEVTEEKNEGEAENENVKDNEEIEEEEEEETDDNEGYEESDDGDRYFGKYAFDEDEEREEEDDDDDNERGSSKPVPRKQKKSAKPNKYNKSSNFKYSENFSSSSKYEKPVKKGKKSVKNPKMHYKAVKYTKEGNGKPRVEKIEGKHSQNIPVIHKQKIFKEKWYVTKSTDDSK